MSPQAEGAGEGVCPEKSQCAMPHSLKAHRPWVFSPWLTSADCLVCMLLLVVPTGVTKGNAVLGTVHLSSKV